MKEIETDRLRLRKFAATDLDDFFEYAKDPNVGPKAGWEPHKDLEASRVILERFIADEEVWAIEYKKNNKLIGSIGLHKDNSRDDVNIKSVGYVLGVPYHNQGIMSEALKAIITYAFEEMGLEQLSIRHYPFNIASRRVIEKAGFTYEGILRRAAKIYDGTIYDCCCYSMLKDEFKRLYKQA